MPMRWPIILLLLSISAVAAAQQHDPARSDLSRFDVSRSDFVALREYIDIRFEAQEKAVAKAEVASEKRFDSVNEFRRQLADQTATFLTRTEYKTELAGLVEKVNALAKRVDEAESRSQGLSNAWGFLVGAIGFGAAIFTILRKGKAQ
jgi:hypothetical protein